MKPGFSNAKILGAARCFALASRPRWPWRLARAALLVLALGVAVVSGRAQQFLAYDLNGNLVGPTIAPGNTPPAIVTPPTYALGQTGGTASFSVIASGSGTVVYQWLRSGSVISGATNDTLLLANLGPSDFTAYSVIVSSAFGSVTSAPPVMLYLDSDRDGIADTWAAAYFGTNSVPSYADSDGDGMLNIDEFLDGTNPTNSASALFTLTVNNTVQVEPVLDRYPAGTVVTLTAEPVGNLPFDEWSGALGGAHNPATLTITSNTVVSALRGEPGLDSAWEPVFTANDGGVYCLLPQPDGKILVGGRFSDLNGRPIQNLARLNPDGTLDTNFVAALELGTTDNGSVAGLALQPDGKILLCGNFTAVDYLPRPYVARLNADGSVDQTFDPGYGPNNIVDGVAILSDGRIAIAGGFSQVAGVNRGGVAILTASGALDPGFAPTNSFSGIFYNVAIQSGNRLLLSGSFTESGNPAVANIARFGTNGMLDATFNPGGAGPNSYVQLTRELPDGDLFCVGAFDHYNSTAGRAVLLDANGNPLSTFTNTAGLNSRALNFAQDSSGGFIISGAFNYYNSTPAQYLARFNSDGTFDAAFAATNAANNQIYALTLQANGALFAGGEFSAWGGVFQDRLIALNPATAVPETNFNLHAAFRSEVTSILLQSDGSMMVGGNFVAVNGQSAQRLVRLTPQGKLDPGFALTNAPNSTVEAITLQPDGNYLVGGSFNYCGNQYAPGLARFLPNGALDPAFSIGAGFDGIVYSVTIQPGVGILVGGSFNDYQGQFRPGLVRLKSNGAVDYDFAAAIGQNNSYGGIIYSFVIQPDGKILIAGEFSTVSGAPRSRIARLMPDGTLDATFNPGSGLDATAYAMALQADGSILVGGNFGYVNGAYRPRLARLLSNGAVDLSYPNNNSGPDSTVWQLAVQPDGSVFLVGDFGHMNGVYQYRCAHLFADGSVDTSFNPGTDLNDNIYTLATGADGSVYLGGNVHQMYSQPRAGMLRLVTSPGLQVRFAGTQPSGLNFTPGQSIQLAATTMSGAGIAGVQFQVSTDGVAFTPLNDAFLGQNSQWTNVWQPLAGVYYLRAVATDNSARQQASLSYGPVTVGSPNTLAGYATWEAANFSLSDQANPAISGEFATPYNDGVPNWLKFATGTPPSSRPTITGGIYPVPGLPQYPTISFRENLAATTVQFAVQVSTNLMTWSDGSSFTTLVDTTQNNDGTETVRMRSNTPVGSQTAQFLRLVLVLP